MSGDKDLIRLILENAAMAAERINNPSPPPEPQTIATALTAQIVINRIIRDQLTKVARTPKNPPPRKPGESIVMGIDDMEKHQVFFNLIFIIAPFEVTGFTSLHKHIIEREPLPPGSLDTLKRINIAAKENNILFEKIQSIEPDEKIFACYKIHPDGSTSRKHNRSGNYEGQRFTNDDLYSYCNEVEGFTNQILSMESPVKARHPEKWYSLYHMILIAIGKPVPNFADSGKSEIVKYGSEQYGTGQGFYNEIRKIDLNRMNDYIRELSRKDRKSWKNTIADISGNNADIAEWLKKQPN